MKIIISIVLCVITSFLLNDFVAFAAERAKSAARSPATQPFRVDFRHWQPAARHAEIFVFSFTPIRGRR
jgi:hypothetical protein